MENIGDTISMGSLKNKPPEKRTKEEEEERERSRRLFGTKDFTMVNRSADVIFDTAWDMMAKMRQLQGDTRMINQLRGKQGTLQQYKDQSQNLRDELKQIDLNTQRQEYMDKLDEVNNLNRQKSDFIESLGRE
tara:strand:- start:842 stop:1240 length:399 start_codon:yes stop_codon:yes gene_type:complete